MSGVEGRDLLLIIILLFCFVVQSPVCPNSDCTSGAILTFIYPSFLLSLRRNNAMIDVLLAWVRCFQRRWSSEQTTKSAPELHTKRFIFNQHAASVILTFTLPTTNPPWVDQVSLRNWAKLLRCDERNGNTKEFHRLLSALRLPPEK